MAQTINERIAALREVMQRERLAAVIFPSTDPHNSEYVADHWKSREWISGFTGSAGTAVVTMTAAALWTDSRYFIAAEEQMKGTEFQLMRLKIAGTPTIAEWIGKMVREEKHPYADWSEVAIDGMCCSIREVRMLIDELRKEGGITLRTNFDALKHIWKDRPAIPTRPVEKYPLEMTGETCHEKLGRIRQALREKHADGMLVAALDDIAWTLNLRGSDVNCNPVFVSYLLISSQRATLYINKEKLTPEVIAYLKGEGVLVDDYENIKSGLKSYFEYNILMDPDEVCYALYKTVTENPKVKSPVRVVEETSPIPSLKAIKNEREQVGFRNAMLRDGIAMVKFLRWLDEQIKSKTTLTEISVSDKLEEFRGEQPLYKGLSFDTIAGYQEHGAIVHYEATPETDVTLRPEGLLLLDSGAQYLDGTTDITRTIALGQVTEEQRRVYTLVLKGHIQLAMLCFPDGASGTQLDALARKDMWKEGMNFLHGTGHGVGSYLCVHEGPQQIRMEYRPAKFHAGMTITDEPGIYLEGRFGVRVENMLLTVPYQTTEFGDFLKFETLTLCPIDTVPIDIDMLTSDELQWLDDYHRHVFDMLSPHLDDAHREWLREATRPLITK